MRTVRDTAPSRRRGLPCRVLKEARRVTTPCAGLPSCTGLMVAAPCSERPGGGHPPIPAASAFAAVARNQSQELRGRRRNQIQLKPPESGGFTPPSTPMAAEPIGPTTKRFQVTANVDPPTRAPRWQVRVTIRVHRSSSHGNPSSMWGRARRRECCAGSMGQYSNAASTLTRISRLFGLRQGQPGDTPGRPARPPGGGTRPQTSE